MVCTIHEIVSSCDDEGKRATALSAGLGRVNVQVSPFRRFHLVWVGVSVVFCSHHQIEFPIAVT
jgi:hypothetical protein